MFCSPWESFPGRKISWCIDPQLNYQKLYSQDCSDEKLQNSKRHKCIFLNLYNRAMAMYFQRRKNKIGQDEFHPKAIYTQEFLLQKMEYMHNNPVRKGLVLKPEYWRYSSARTYLNGEENDVNICMDRLFDDS